MSAPEPVAVTVTCGEVVVPHGRATVGWLVEVDGEARPVNDFPGAEFTDVDARPGCVWEQHVTLRVPPGTVLERVASRPRPVREDALTWLVRDLRAAPRHVDRRRFRVDARGELQRLPDVATKTTAPRPPGRG